MPPRPPQTGNVEDIRVRHDWTGLRETPPAEQGKGKEVETERGTQGGLFLMLWVCTAALAFVSCI